MRSQTIQQRTSFIAYRLTSLHICTRITQCRKESLAAVMALGYTYISLWALGKHRFVFALWDLVGGSHTCWMDLSAAPWLSRNSYCSNGLTGCKHIYQNEFRQHMDIAVLLQARAERIFVFIYCELTLCCIHSGLVFRTMKTMFYIVTLQTDLLQRLHTSQIFTPMSRHTTFQ